MFVYITVIRCVLKGHLFVSFFCYRSFVIRGRFANKLFAFFESHFAKFCENATDGHPWNIKRQRMNWSVNIFQNSNESSLWLLCCYKYVAYFYQLHILHQPPRMFDSCAPSMAGVDILPVTIRYPHSSPHLVRIWHYPTQTWSGSLLLGFHWTKNHKRDNIKI